MREHKMKIATTATTTTSTESSGSEDSAVVPDKGLLSLGDIFASLESKLLAQSEHLPSNTKRQPDSKKPC